MVEQSYTRKDMLIKTAIRDYASDNRIGKNNYGSISNRDLLYYMKTNRMGVRWVSKMCIKTIRSKLPMQYREKLDE